MCTKRKEYAHNHVLSFKNNINYRDFPQDVENDPSAGKGIP